MPAASSSATATRRIHALPVRLFTTGSSAAPALAALSQQRQLHHHIALAGTRREPSERTDGSRLGFSRRIASSGARAAGGGTRAVAKVVSASVRALCTASAPREQQQQQQQQGQPSGRTYEQALSNPPAPPTGKTVTLKWERHEPRSSDKAGGTSEIVDNTGAIVVAHGLFGSKQNWRTLAKSMAARTGLPVYAVDLRNHGESPHVDSLHYADMAEDVITFLRDSVRKEIGEKGIVLIGHSMGGKAAQAAALSPNLPTDLLTGLISVDMSPKRGALSKEFAGYVDGMQEIERAGCASRKEADEILQRWEQVQYLNLMAELASPNIDHRGLLTLQDVGVRQFLLTNLTKDPPSQEFWTFRIPLDIIQRHISQLGDFPYSDGERTWDGRSLFVKGSKSAYINHKNIPLAAKFFPQMRLATLEAGHWVQAEKPKEFVDLVERFVKGEDVGERP
ncbi:hypothetical protein OC842_006468 [Tilletia horrida]|uniref:AB hydrolase-1 domain-containing protein n=1 Tax=Tilletia horrida TaxID=155126 RepID=A0AAN6G612_9BASI|nr:hypothetical protein OC842_006468 [Tilletia horrida]